MQRRILLPSRSVPSQMIGGRNLVSQHPQSGSGVPLTRAAGWDTERSHRNSDKTWALKREGAISFDMRLSLTDAGICRKESSYLVKGPRWEPQCSSRRYWYGSYNVCSKWKALLDMDRALIERTSQGPFHSLCFARQVDPRITGDLAHMLRLAPHSPLFDDSSPLKRSSILLHQDPADRGPMIFGNCHRHLSLLGPACSVSYPVKSKSTGQTQHQPTRSGTNSKNQTTYVRPLLPCISFKRAYGSAGYFRNINVDTMIAFFSSTSST